VREGDRHGSNDVEVIFNVAIAGIKVLRTTLHLRRELLPPLRVSETIEVFHKHRNSPSAGHLRVRVEEASNLSPLLIQMEEKNCYVVDRKDRLDMAPYISPPYLPRT
jgi:hypothetical protein